MFNNFNLDNLVQKVESIQHEQFEKLINRLDRIISLLDTMSSSTTTKLNTIISKENTIMATIQDVTDAIAAESTVDDSIIALLNGIVIQLQAAQASGDPAALDTVVAGIQSNAAKIQAAVVANTPAATV